MSYSPRLSFFPTGEIRLSAGLEMLAENLFDFVKKMSYQSPLELRDGVEHKSS